MSGLLAPDVQETITGTAQILEIFKVSGAGKVAGSKVTEGEINSTSDVRIIRDGAIIYTGKVSSIFREKNQVKQVKWWSRMWNYSQRLYGFSKKMTQ